MEKRDLANWGHTAEATELSMQKPGMQKSWCVPRTKSESLYLGIETIRKDRPKSRTES